MFRLYVQAEISLWKILLMIYRTASIWFIPMNRLLSIQLKDWLCMFINWLCFSLVIAIIYIFFDKVDVIICLDVNRNFYLTHFTIILLEAMIMYMPHNLFTYYVFLDLFYRKSLKLHFKLKLLKGMEADDNLFCMVCLQMRSCWIMRVIVNC